MKKPNLRRQLIYVGWQISHQKRTARSANQIKRMVAKRRFEKIKIYKPVGISAPEIFSISSNVDRHELMHFIDRITAAMLSGRNVRLNFEKTTSLKPCGTLYFVSVIDDLLSKFTLTITAKYPPNDIVEQLFQHIGLLEKFGLPSRKVVTADNVVNWHFAKGTDATMDVFSSLLTAHQKSMGGEITKSELYDCLSEAVTNTKAHAYLNISDAPTTWWMFSQAVNGRLTVAISDLGIGISKSLLQKPELSDYLRKLRRLASKNHLDEDLIKIAVSSDRTKTGLPYRGKGLPQMLDFIKKGADGGFRVQSSFGIFQHDAKISKTETATLKKAIRGTLIEWTLPLNYVTE